MLPIRDLKPSLIQDWEKAGTSLASAISRFFELSTLLESQCMTADMTTNDLVARIDSSLSLFQTTLDGQFTQARLALAKTRNRLMFMRSGNILQLPEEILADIFLKFVYNPYEEDEFPTSRLMNLDVQLIYQRVHTLLEVCTSWRQIAIACGSLWSVVPIVDPDVGRPRVLSTKLSLQRAGNQNLHLAIFKPHSLYERLQALVPRLSQLDSINVQSESASAFQIHEVIRLLIDHQGPKSLSKLSLCHSAGPLPNDPGFNPFTSLEPQLIDLIKSLSVLRIHKITIAWEAISFKFSDRLTELWMDQIRLDEMATPGFFLALTSAPELHHLTIVDTRALLEDVTICIPSTTPFPKLKSLHLESLPFNLLDLVLDFIGSGSYRLTLNPCGDIYDNYPGERVEEEDICALLRKSPVHKLILVVGEDYFWETAEGLHRILKCVPLVKNLVLNLYGINTNILEAFVLPPGGNSTAFPNLEVLEIHAATFDCPLSELRMDFSKILDHHSIQRMVLGGMIEISDMEAATPLDADEDTLRWLKARVPQFSVLDDPEGLPALVEKWQLWDM